MLGINGLLYIPNYISIDQEQHLVKNINSSPWRDDLSRRVQHYGYIYDYKKRSVDPSMYLGDLPTWLEPIITQLQQDGLMPIAADQAIINEYEPGQGIADHIDCTPCFGDVVVSLSLLSPVVMEFKQDDAVQPLLLEPRSVMVMRGEARYKWTHGTPKRKTDPMRGHRVKRNRRLSVTFRTVILDDDS